MSTFSLAVNLVAVPILFHRVTGDMQGLGNLSVAEAVEPYDMNYLENLHYDYHLFSSTGLLLY